MCTRLVTSPVAFVNLAVGGADGPHSLVADRRWRRVSNAVSSLYSGAVQADGNQAAQGAGR
jgi:hypothetical protein